MKNLLLIITLLTSFSLSAQDDITVTVCNQKIQKRVAKKSTYNYITLSQEKLMKCNELKTNNSKWHVSSFSIGFSVGSDYLEIKTKGNSITEKMIETIKEHNPDKIYIEKIVVSDKNEEALRVKTLVIELHNQSK